MSDAPHDVDRIDPQVWKIAAVVLMGPFMTGLDSTVVNVSLSTLSSELHASIGSIQWVVSGYLFALALMLPLSGWLVDRVGAKRIYIVCFAAFTAASMLCGMAHTCGMLIAFRVLQGATGGLLAPMTQMMLARVAGRHMAHVLSLSAMPVLLAPLLGPAVAGSILQYGSWRWLFYLNLPIGTAATLLAARVLPKDDATLQNRRFDLLGFLLLSPSLALLLFGLEYSGTWPGKISLFAAVPLLAGFVSYAARKGAVAIIDVALFRERVFSAAALNTFIANGLTFGGQMLVPLYLITQCGLSTGRTGLLFMSVGIGMFCSVPSLGFLTDRFGCRPVSTGGAALALIGTLPFVWMEKYGLSIPVTCVGLFLRGVGLGVINTPSMAAAYASVPRDKLPVATTALNIVQRMGGPLATTLLAIVLEWNSRHGRTADHASFRGGFLFLSSLHVLSVLAALRLPLHINHPHEAAQAVLLQAAEALAD